MSDTDPQLIDQICSDIRCGFDAFKKKARMNKVAFTPAAPPAGPMMAQDPNAMPPQGDPGTAPPPGAMPPGAPMDPNAMPPQGDPGAMPPAPDQGAAGQGVPPELQQILSDLAGGVEGMSNTMKEQQSAIDQLSQRQLENEKLIEELRQALKGPQPFEAPAATSKAPAPAESSAPEATPAAM